MKGVLFKYVLAIVTAFCMSMGQLSATAKDEVKPSKEDRKAVKAYVKEGWKAPIGVRPIEYQLAQHAMMMSEMIRDDESDAAGMEYEPRYYSGTGIAVAGSYNAAMSMARTKAQGEIASAMETSLVRMIQNKVNVGQTDAVSATTSDNFHEETRALIRQTLANTQQAIVMYREIPNHNYEVSLTLVYDKRDLAESIKKMIRAELNAEGQEFFDEVNDSLKFENAE